MSAMEAVLLKIARKDLEASRILFREKLYSQAVFFLQQSVEKAAKAMGLREGWVSKEQLKHNIGHRAWKVFTEISNIALKIQRQLEGVREEEHVSKILPPLKDLLNVITHDLIPLLEEYKKEEKNMGSPSKTDETIDSVINLLYPVLKSGELQKILDEDVEARIHELLEPLSEITGKELMTKLRWEEIGGRLVLFIFSFLLERHAIWSRYPDERFSPLEYYSERTSLIKRFNEIANMVDGALKEIEQLYGIS
jgi:HEPN domain-containing protein